MSHRYVKLACISAPFLFITVFFYVVSPTQLVTYIGTENAYVLMFVTALIGGISIFSGVPYVAILVALALGGMNPYLLGFVTALGVLIGDSTSYFFASRVSIHEYTRIAKYISVIEHWYHTYPQRLPIFFFLYGLFSPFPNDIITITAGVYRYSYFRMILPLFMGNVIFVTVVAKCATLFSGVL
jgi:membrane protein YqaA with SNARE-associated domain